MFAGAAIALLCALIGAIVLLGAPRPPATPVAEMSPFPSPSATAIPAAVDSLDEDIGAVMVLSWFGATPWSEVASVLVKDQVGGVLLFTPDFGGTPAGARALSDRIEALARSECLSDPIQVMLDEEGGDVANVKASFAPPWPAVMAAAGAGQVRALETANGAGLRASGVNLDLAPVADVRTNPADLVIGARSFGSNPATVPALVAAAVEGLHAGGVGATLKHFPGLGGAAGDPHVAIPTDRESEARWLQVQAPSFRAGIVAGADAVMTTAVYVPGLGGGSLPAMFSPAVVGRLRTQLGFGGVNVSDSLSMGGIGARWPLPEAAIMALGAGNDMLLLGNGDVGYEAEAIAAVKAAVLSGRLSRAALHASAERVNALRDRWARGRMPCRAPLAG